jgi:phosphoadenosine phosphosulfate reductase
VTTAIRPTPLLAQAADAWFDGIEDPVEQALTVLKWAGDTFGDDFAITSSMADGLLAHLASEAVPGIHVIFLDTGYHFAETLGTRDWITSVLPVTLVNVRPEQSVAEQDAAYGPTLYERDPDLCCSLRKVSPLAQQLDGYVDWDDKRGMLKINPLAAWTQDVVDRYVAEHGVPVNPLVELGYASIGCAPCTRPVAAGEDPRAGRWAGRSKTECGIHA